MLPDGELAAGLVVSVVSVVGVMSKALYGRRAVAKTQAWRPCEPVFFRGFS